MRREFESLLARQVLSHKSLLVHPRPVPFDFARAHVVHENQRAIGFVPIGLDVPSRALLEGNAVPAAPVRFRQHLGSAVADLMMGGDPALLIVSQLVMDTLSGIAATGWGTWPVECRTKRGEPIPGLYGLSVIGRCGPPQWGRSERFESQLAPGAPPVPHVRGLYFDEDSWDGSDVFSPAGTTFVVVTDRVYGALRASGVRNSVSSASSTSRCWTTRRCLPRGDSAHPRLHKGASAAQSWPVVGVVGVLRASPGRHRRLADRRPLRGAGMVPTSPSGSRLRRSVRDRARD